MDGAGKPTQITLDRDANVVVRKGTATVELRADGSIYVNGQKVAEGNVNDNTPAPVKDAAPAPQQDTAAPEPAAETPKEDPSVRRKELIQKYLKEGMSAMDAMRKVEEMLQQETLQRDAGITPAAPTPVPEPAAEQPVAPQTEPQPQQESPAPEPVAAGPQIGQSFEDKGVFVGVWQPRDKNGQSLGKVFNVYAAPADLMDDDDNKLMLTFNDAAKHVAGLKDWHGHDGGDYANDAALIKALKKDKYAGEWFIPPLEMMALPDAAGEYNKLGMVTLARNSGALAGTFKKVNGSLASQMYWTSTETADDPDFVQYVDLDEERGARKLVNYVGRDYNKLVTRVVRLEPRV